ncbi:MAG TPA: PASTA domain-containing protein, partial [Phytomonospora sp.]
EAKAELEALKFRVTTAIVTSEKEDKNKVVAQDPSGGKADQGSEVKLSIGGGPDMTTVPNDLVGMPLNEAQAALTEAGLKYDWVEVDGVEAANTVLSVEPEEGKKIEAGGTVMLTVSRGNQFIMPELVEMSSVDQARQKLNGLGWSGNFDTSDGSQPGFAPGSIIGQSPEPGSKVNKTATINLTIQQEATGSSSSASGEPDGPDE